MEGQSLTQVEETLQVKSVTGTVIIDSSKSVVYQECMLEGGWATNSDHMPLIVI